MLTDMFKWLVNLLDSISTVPEKAPIKIEPVEALMPDSVKKEYVEAPPLDGFIKHFKLESWWLNELDDDCRSYLLSNYVTDYCRGEQLINGKVKKTEFTVIKFLRDIYEWVSAIDKRTWTEHDIWIRTGKELERRFQKVWRPHSNYSGRIEKRYRQRREDEDAIEDVKALCKKHISGASRVMAYHKDRYPNDPLPYHDGFSQLVIILEKEGNYLEAINYCQMADFQGWQGDWENRIERMRTKMDK